MIFSKGTVVKHKKSEQVIWSLLKHLKTKPLKTKPQPSTAGAVWKGGAAE